MPSRELIHGGHGDGKVDVYARVRHEMHTASGNLDVHFIIVNVEVRQLIVQHFGRKWASVSLHVCSVKRLGSKLRLPWWQLRRQNRMYVTINIMYLQSLKPSILITLLEYSWLCTTLL